MIRAFWLALAFLTRIPVPPGPAPTGPELGRSVLFYPFVGLALGGALTLAHTLLQATAPFLEATLLLCLWVGLTGGLHVDGLADVADAWAGGRGEPGRVLELMRDPRSGPAAIAAVVLVLLLKLTALAVILERQAWPALIAVPMLGRTTLLVMLLTIPYIRPGGLGAEQARYLPKRAGRGTLAIVGLLAIGLLSWRGVLLLMLLMLAGALARAALVRRLGGITGDLLGAGCELTEAAALVVLALA